MSNFEHFVTDYGWILPAILIVAGIVVYFIENWTGYVEDPEGFDDSE